MSLRMGEAGMARPRADTRAEVRMTLMRVRLAKAGSLESCGREQASQVLRQGRRERHRLASRRMTDPELPGVERLPRKRPAGRGERGVLQALPARRPVDGI